MSASRDIALTLFRRGVSLAGMSVGRDSGAIAIGNAGLIPAQQDM